MCTDTDGWSTHLSTFHLFSYSSWGEYVSNILCILVIISQLFTSVHFYPKHTNACSLITDREPLVRFL